jgi:hypothetical protein
LSRKKVLFSIFLKGRVKEAVSAFKKAMDRGSEKILAHPALANTYSMMGREMEARTEVKLRKYLRPLAMEIFPGRWPGSDN